MTAIQKLFSSEGWADIRQSFEVGLRRFPLAHLAAVSAFLLMAQLLTQQEEASVTLQKIAITSILSIGLFIGLELAAERRGWPKWVSLSIGLALLCLFYFISYPIEKLGDNTPFMLQFVATFIGIHAFVSVGPYWRNATIEAFWQYNKTLFIRFLTAMLYAVTLTVGLNLALAAIKGLFKVDVPNDAYVYVGTSMMLFASTAIFLGKFPKLEAIDRETAYPLFLKYFTQYVLLPLVAVYLLILLSYEAKILIQWQLPKGWVSLMVLASGVVGMLAFLLLYPLRFANTWVLKYTKFYYWLLLPLIALMAAAIYVRVQQYGFTEERYIVAALTVWLLGISLYFIFSKVDDIRYVPVTLGLLAFTLAFMPFLNMFSFSERHQAGRLEAIAKAQNLLKEGKLAIAPTQRLSRQANDRLHAAVEYLASRNSAYLYGYLNPQQADSLQKSSPRNRYIQVVRLLNLPPKMRDAESTISRHLNVSANRDDGVERTWRADYTLSIFTNTNRAYSLDNRTLTISADAKKVVIRPQGLAAWEIPVQEYKQWMAFETVDESRVTRTHEDAQWQYRLILQNMYFPENDSPSYTFKLFLTKK